MRVLHPLKLKRYEVTEEQDKLIRNLQIKSDAFLSYHAAFDLLNKNKLIRWFTE